MFKFIFSLILLVSLAHAEEFKPLQLKTYPANKAFDWQSTQGKTVVINFFASWCTACIKELPELEELKKQHPSAVFIAVNVGEGAVLIKKFLSRYTFSYQILQDPTKALASSLGIEELPRTLVVKDAQILYNGHRPPPLQDPKLWSK